MEAEVMRVAAFPKARRSLKLFSDFNRLQFASVMAIVVFVVLLIFMTVPTPHGGTSVDLPKVLHPVSMRGADREDAMTVNITRDGKVYFGSEQMNVANTSQEIKERLKNPEIEHKVYIVADARTRRGPVKLVLQGVHDAGILRVAFLASQRNTEMLTTKPLVTNP